MKSDRCITPLVERLRAHIPVEGQEGLRVRDALMREAANEIERLRSQLRQAERDAREDAISAAAEVRWQERQGDDYGSY